MTRNILLTLSLLSATAAYAREAPQCEAAETDKGDIERILGKWPALVVSKIQRIVFLQESVGGEAASFNPLTDDITITNDHFSSLDHELGHLVYEQIREAKRQVMAPLLEEYHTLQEKYEDKESLWASPEYKTINEKIAAAQISETFSLTDWSDFLLYLENYPEAQCSKVYLHAGYEELPRLHGKVAQIVNLAQVVIDLSQYKETMPSDDAAYVLDFLKEYKTYVNQFKEVRDKTLLPALENDDQNCSTQDQEDIREIFVMLSEQADALTQRRERIEAIKERVYQNQEDSLEKDVEKTNADLSLLEATISELQRAMIPHDIVQNELFARAASSLMNVYFGQPQTGHFQLDENILAGFERIQIDGVLVFQDAVIRYRNGMELHQKGRSEERIKNKLLSGIPKGDAPPFVCFESADAYTKDVLERDREQKKREQ